MKILVKCVAGSHLFGTNTEKSDKDFKGIFLPTKEDILLGKLGKTTHENTNKSGTKNTSADVDVEFYSLDKWLKMLYEGQTVAWELLFTPDSHILEKHPLWDEIRAKAPLLVNRKVDAFVGYCKQQANKYGTRGSRMGTVEKVLEYLKPYQTVRAVWRLNMIDLSPILELEHVEIIKNEKHLYETGKECPDMLSVIGKKFPLTTDLNHVIPVLQLAYENYGERSRQAKLNEGVDWKALSHAIRVCYQAQRLLSTGTLKLPLPEPEIAVLSRIKAGKCTFEEISQMLEYELGFLQKCQENSTLPEFPNKEEFDAIQISVYNKIVAGEI